MIDQHQKEKQDFEAAKLASEVQVNSLSLTIQRSLQRIDKLFPRPQGNGKAKRECSAFSRSKMFGFLSDLARDLHEAYDHYGELLDTYSRIPPLADIDYQESSPEKMFLSAKYDNQLLALYAPTAIRSNKAHVNAKPYTDHVCAHALRDIPCDLFAGVQQVQEYLIMVYPEDATDIDVIDLDNIDSKVFGDAIFRKIGMDDNCRRLPTIVAYSLFTDTLKSGFYTLVLPESCLILNPEEVQSLLEMLF